MNRPDLRTACATLFLTLLASGCGRVVFRPNQPVGGPGQQAVTLTAEQQQLLAQREQDLRRRAEGLDRDNQELESLLAQSRQQVSVLNEHILATQGQLKATTEQLAAAQSDNTELRNRAEALLASTQAGGRTVGFAPNTSLTVPVALQGLPGVDVRQDGDVIRVSVPTDELFYTGGAQLLPTGERVLASTATQLLEAYPGHVLGIEGHTDGAPVASPQFPTGHHLSVAQATSAYDALRRIGVPAAQLFVIGHGANHPRVSNATEAGRQANRRLEVVVYPEKARRR